jgi:hypothetical protein
MRYEPIKRRLAKLEHGASTADAVLLFADDSTRAVSVKHPLSLFCAACSRLSSAISTPEHLAELRASGVSLEMPEARPVSAYDGLIEMFGRASGIKSDDRFLYWIQDVCRQVIEEEQKAPKTFQ